MLTSKDCNLDLSLKIDASDYRLKERLSDSSLIKVKTIETELIEIKQGFLVLKNRGTDIKFSDVKTVNNFTILSVIISSKDDPKQNIIIPLGFSIIDNYYFVGFALEGIKNSTSDEAESKLIKCLNYTKD